MTSLIARQVFIVDDHPLVRSGLKYLIDGEPDMTVCGEASDVETALFAVKKSINPDVMLVDLSLPDGNGLDLIKKLQTTCPHIATLVVSMHDDWPYVERCLHAGARGFLSKQEAGENIIAALREVFDGQIYLNKKMAERIKTSADESVSFGAFDGLNELTEREQEVFLCIGAGQSTVEIAEALYVSVKTIETHRANIKRKLGFRTGSELTRAAIVECFSTKS